MFNKSMVSLVSRGKLSAVAIGCGAKGGAPAPPNRLLDQEEMTSPISRRKKSFTPLVRANMTNAAISGEPQRRAARNRRGAPPGLNINYP
ncbi:unnamed protein product, partial [Brenthis ino]